MIRSGIFSLATVCLAISAPLAFRVLVPAFASAQASETTELPQVFVNAVTVSATSPSIVGAFESYNEETTVQGGLRYKVQVLGPAPASIPGQLVADTAPEYDAIVSSQTFTLLPQETRTFPFSYEPPQLPEGDYRLRIQWLTSQGRRLGWADAPIHLGVPGAPFVLLQSGPVVGPDDQLAEPQEGVNVPPNSSLTVQGIATNTATTPLTVTPRITVYKWGIAGEKMTEENLAPLSLASGEKDKVIAIPLTALTTPDAYQVVLTLHDAAGARLSSNAQWRYVVEGVSAKVVAARFTRFAIKQGDTTTITANVVGPADRETTLNGTVDIALLDRQTVVAQQENTSVTLDENVQTITASFPLSADLTQPGLRVTIRGTDGAVLDTYEVTPELTPEQLAEVATPVTPAEAPYAMGRWIILALLVVVALILIAILVWYRRSARVTPAAPLVLVLAVGAALLSYGWYAQANGILVSETGKKRIGDSNTISLFINQPRHAAASDPNKIQYPKTSVPVEFNVSYNACDNAPTSAEVQVLYNNAAGHVRNYPLGAGTLLGKFSDTVERCTTSHTCQHNWNGLSGTFSVGQSFPHDTTTLQFIGKWQRRHSKTGKLDTATDVMNVFTNLIDATPPPSLPPTPVAATCSPANQTVSVNVLASFSASEPGLWSAPGGTPSSGQGTTFSARYATPGSKTVTVATPAEQPTCSVQVVAAPPPTSGGPPFNPGPITETE